MAKSVAAALYAWFFVCLVGCASVNSVPPQNDLQYLASWRDKKAIAFLNTEAFSSSDPLYWRLPNGGSRPPTLSNSFQSEIDEIVRQLSETPIIGKSDFVVVGSDCS